MVIIKADIRGFDYFVKVTCDEPFESILVGLTDNASKYDSKNVAEYYMKSAEELFPWKFEIVKF
jgi:hypothetical protein